MPTKDPTGSCGSGAESRTRTRGGVVLGVRLDRRRVTLLGLGVGSFPNVVIHCVPPPVGGAARPRCPRCDNVPFLSYALLRGRCRIAGMHLRPLPDSRGAQQPTLRSDDLLVGPRPTTASRVRADPCSHRAGSHGPRAPALAERNRWFRGAPRLRARHAREPRGLVVVPALPRLPRRISRLFINDVEGVFSEVR